MQSKLTKRKYLSTEIDEVLRHDKICMNFENIGPSGCSIQHKLCLTLSHVFGIPVSLGRSDSLITKGILE